MEITARHHLRSDGIDRLQDHLSRLFGMEIEGETFESVQFSDESFSIILVDGQPYVLEGEAGLLPTVRGANAAEPTKRVIVVDAGAVAFVGDGADVMRPGIVEADERIAEGDPVLIAEENHRKVLAVGLALTDGKDMLGEQGKVVESLHYVGDEIYEFTP